MNIRTGSDVILIDSMGDDLTIVAAARTSTGAEKTKGDEKDRKLLEYLWKNHHHSPFEQLSFTFHVKTPIFVARQMMRHRTGKFNEASARYKEMPLDFWMPETFRAQNLTGNKQGSDGEIENGAWAKRQVEAIYTKVGEVYENLLRMGVAKEIARTVLPVGLYTEMVVTFDLRNLLHFIKLRKDPHAQPEIQEVAFKMLELIRPIVPWTIQAFLDNFVGQE